MLAILKVQKRVFSQKQHLLGAALGLALLCPHAAAQDVRGLGMGGVLLPGPAAVPYNPAFMAYDAPPYASGFVLPLGLLNFVLRPEMNFFNALGGPSSPAYKTFYDNFDGLAALDQALHLNTFILNPAKSPGQINVTFDQNGLRFTDGNGTPLNLNFSSGNAISGVSGPTPLLNVPISTGGFGFGLSLDTNSSGPLFTIDPRLQAAIASGGLGANTNYDINVKASARLSVGLNFGYALAIPLPEVKLYVGARGTAFYGAAYADANLTFLLKTDGNGVPQLPSTTPDKGTLFTVYPGQGAGFGATLDLGVAAEIPSVAPGQLLVGLGAVNLVDFSSWNGQETTYVNGAGTTVSASRTITKADPVFTVNLAYTASFKDLGAGDFPGSLLVAFDAQYGRGGFATHLGAEGQLGFVLLRAGIGYNNGLQFGLGAGFDLGAIGFDLALTSHQAPVVQHTSFGVALALRLKF